MMHSKHTIPMSGGWRLWRCAPLRGTGFPTSTILRVAAPAAAQAARTVIQAEQQQRDACTAALEAVRQHSQSGKILRADARKAIAKLRKGAAPSNASALGPAQQLAEHVAQLAEASHAAHKHYSLCYEKDLDLVTAALAECASDPRFEEAMTWQNPEAASLVLPKVRNLSHKRNRGFRQAQSLVANYLQRYCAKNDTIGFFGPVGWAELTEHDDISVVPGAALLRQREVYFEHWALLHVAAHFAQSDEIRHHLAPRLLPTVRVGSDNIVRYGVGKSVSVPAQVADLLLRATGERSATAIASDICEAAETDVDDPDEVFQMLEELVEMGLVLWTIEVPSGGPNATSVLREVLEALPATSAVREALSSLSALDRARADVQACAGAPKELAAKLRALNAQFTALVGESATRNAGKMYAGRTIAYEDCSRDISASIGTPFVETFAPALRLMALSARWFSYEIAKQYRDLADAIFNELLADDNDSVDYVAFWKKLAPAFPESADEKSSIALRVRETLAKTWARIFDIAEDATGVVQLHSENLLEKAEEAFAAPCPGWPSARHVSPDIMLAASPESLAAGDFLGVLGEIHLGNSIPSTVRLQQHESPMTLFEWNDEDLGMPIVCPVQPGDLVTRADRVSWSDTDLSLELGVTRSFRDRSNVLRAADLIVRRTDGLLRVETRDGLRSFDIIAFLDQYLTFITTSNFSWAPDSDYVPRVVIDKLVVLRQQWKFSEPRELAFVTMLEGPEQFLACQRWAKAQGLPRWVFYKVPEETKPVFLDFESPILVAKARNLLNKASKVTISEMSPSFDELWLTDAEKNTYASELRIVALDPEGWRP